jgi:hypothetical protein
MFINEATIWSSSNKYIEILYLFTSDSQVIISPMELKMQPTIHIWTVKLDIDLFEHFLALFNYMV